MSTPRPLRIAGPASLSRRGFLAGAAARYPGVVRKYPEMIAPRAH